MSKRKIMRKLFTVLTLSVFVAIGCMNAQQGQGKYKFEGVFTLNYSDDVRIEVGGASQTKSSGEWKSGSKVGKHEIDGKTFEKMKAAASKQFKIQIEKASLGTLHRAKVTDLKTNTSYTGIYDAKYKKLTFGDLKGKSTGKDSGELKGGLVDCRVDTKTGEITKGNYSIVHAVNKGALILSIRAIFKFTGSLEK